jgi:hypothetical protein
MATKKSAPNLDITPELSAASKALAPAVKRLTKLLATIDHESMPYGALADSLYDMKQLTKMLNTLTAPFDDLLLPSAKAAEEHFVQKLAVGEASGVQGMKSRVQVTEAVIPVVEVSTDGWAKVYAHIKKTGHFDLLNKALNKTAVQERWDQHKQVPGVSKFRHKKVSVTKLSGK